MKNKLSKLFSYLPIMYGVMLRRYRNLKTVKKNEWVYVKGVIKKELRPLYWCFGQWVIFMLAFFLGALLMV
jgi:hypothetical protein